MSQHVYFWINWKLDFPKCNALFPQDPWFLVELLPLWFEERTGSILVIVTKLSSSKMLWVLTSDFWPHMKTCAFEDSEYLIHFTDNDESKTKSWRSRSHKQVNIGIIVLYCKWAVWFSVFASSHFIARGFPLFSSLPQMQQYRNYHSSWTENILITQNNTIQRRGTNNSYFSETHLLTFEAV